MDKQSSTVKACKDGDRLRKRNLRIWNEDYLVYRYLWINLQDAIQDALAKVEAHCPNVLDIGCGNKPYRDLFGSANYIGLNFSRNHAQPDILGDAMSLPFSDQVFDIVFCTQVIEHVPEPERVINESYRMLRPGGVLILSCPFYWPLHEQPYDYYRFTKYGLEYMLRKYGFCDIKITPDGGSWAQAFLSLTLSIPWKLRLLRVATNWAGLVMDTLFKKFTSPSNYTVYACRPTVSSSK